jgi:hypothetical protein
MGDRGALFNIDGLCWIDTDEDATSAITGCRFYMLNMMGYHKFLVLRLVQKVYERVGCFTGSMDRSIREMGCRERVTLV